MSTEADHTSASSSSDKPTIEALAASAGKAYSLKKYTESADLYAQACQLQSEANGDDDPANAELLFQYGRALFQVGLQKNDVLGSAPGADKKKRELETVDEEEEVLPKEKGKVIQIEGDDNFLEEDEDEADEDGENEEEEDDPMNDAWDILDLSRVLFEKRLAAESDPEAQKKIKVQLSDTIDLLGDVALESENFDQAPKEFAEALRIKKEIYPPEHNYIAEAHFKLGLALEFASQSPEIDGQQRKDLRAKAAAEVEATIESCKARLEKEEAAVEGEGKGKGKAEVDSDKEKQIEEVKGFIVDLEAKLEELKLDAPVVAEEDNEVVKGLLAQVLGRAEPERKKVIQEAVGSANDLTGLVRKKNSASSEQTKPKAETTAGGEKSAANGTANGAAKRKVEEVVEEVPVETSKRARVEDAEDS